MASITVQRVQVLDNPSTFLSDFRFEITFECIAPINDGEAREGDRTRGQAAGWCRRRRRAPGSSAVSTGAGLAGERPLRDALPHTHRGATPHTYTTSPPPPHPTPPPPADLEWKVVYVGSASSSKYDQELDSVLVGPVPIGVSRFILQTPHPDPAKIPDDDIIGATVIMIQCLYKNKEFIRIGYYISHEYTGELGEGEPQGGADGMGVRPGHSSCACCRAVPAAAAAQ